MLPAAAYARRISESNSNPEFEGVIPEEEGLLAPASELQTKYGYGDDTKNDPMTTRSYTKHRSPELPLTDPGIYGPTPRRRLRSDDAEPGGVSRTLPLHGENRAAAEKGRIERDIEEGKDVVLGGYNALPAWYFRRAEDEERARAMLDEESARRLLPAANAKRGQ
jgi:hypothetical protein